MAPIEVDPTTLNASGAQLVSDGDELAAAMRAFSGSLDGFNAGQDTAGKVFSLSYMTNGQQIAKAALSALGACEQVGFGIQVSASNYALAEAGANVDAPAPSVPSPTKPETKVSVTIPSAMGDGIAEPLLWSLVEMFIGDFWPNGDPGAIRAAAGPWSTLGTTLTRVGGEIPSVKPGVIAHDIPEKGEIGTAIDEIASVVTELGTASSTMGTELTAFADEVENTQDAIRDLLSRLSPSGLLDTIGDFFSGDNPLDEIKQIAGEIMAVLRNLGRQAEARVQAIGMVVSAMESAADALTGWISKEFPVIAPVVNAMIDFDVGAWKNVFGMIEGIAALNPMIFAYNPQGAFNTWKGTLEGLAMLANPTLLVNKIATDPQGALNMGKALIDWEDLSGDHPWRGVGYNVTTIASFFIPGGAAVKPGTAALQVGRATTTAARVESRLAAGLAEDLPGLGRLPGMDAAATARLAERLDHLPQIKPIELPKPGEMPKPGEAPRPGASLPEGRPGEPTNPGTPIAEPRPDTAPPHPGTSDAPRAPTDGVDPGPGPHDPPGGHAPDPSPGPRADAPEPPRSTIPATEAPHAYTPEDVRQALADAPRNADGVPIDHRNGQPLRLEDAGGNRGWHMRWDPDSNSWVPENPSLNPDGFPAHGDAGSYGYDDAGNRLPYANQRPDYAPSQVENVWTESRDAQLADIDSGVTDLPTPGTNEQWVLTMDDAEGSNVFVTANGDHYRLVEWEPGQPRTGQWDMGHVPTQEYRTLRDQYLSGDIDLDTFLSEYRNPDNYTVQDPRRNSSHVDEGP